MWKLFGAKKQEVPAAKILIASLSDVFAKETEADTDVYRRHYRSVETHSFRDFQSLEQAIEGVDLLHLFARIHPDGHVSTVSGEQFQPKALLDACVSCGIKVVIIASENEADAYIRGVPARPLNLVMTLSRKGNHFPEFLDKICGLLVSGATLPTAWAKLAPQGPGPRHDILPECIFHAGMPNALLQ